MSNITHAQRIESSRLSDAQREQFIRDGYVIVPGLLPEEAVTSTRGQLLSATGMRQEDPATWNRQATVLFDLCPLTTECWTDELLDVSTELAGPHIYRGQLFSPYRESQGLDPYTVGYVPVLNYPTPGPEEFEEPDGYHLDGMHRTTLFPNLLYLVVFAYLTDVPAYGGATAAWPGSHRKLFQHWLGRETDGNGSIPDHTPDIDLGRPIPMLGHAGDVIFMHYLLAHSGSANHANQIRIGLNSSIHPDAAHPYVRKDGPPHTDWTPIDWTLRTDNLSL